MADVTAGRGLLRCYRGPSVTRTAQARRDRRAAGWAGNSVLGPGSAQSAAVPRGGPVRLPPPESGSARCGPGRAAWCFAGMVVLRSSFPVRGAGFASNITVLCRCRKGATKFPGDWQRGPLFKAVR